MRILRDEKVAPAGHFATEVRKGQVLRIIDLEGQQVADLVTFNARNLSEKLSVMNCVNLNKQVFPRVGYVLYSDEANAMMTIIADTCGVHDMLAGACSRFTNERRYGVKDTNNCRDNLAAALEPWGIGWKDVPFNMNVFMNAPSAATAVGRFRCPGARPATTSISVPRWTWSQRSRIARRSTTPVTPSASSRYAPSSTNTSRTDRA
jgi:uncharacterized protein YcgI (DUF1989 family)